jgi:hypothetical protein
LLLTLFRLNVTGPNIGSLGHDHAKPPGSSGTSRDV